MAETDLALFSDRARNREGLEPFADDGSGFFSGFDAAFEGQCSAHRVGPACVFKANGLNAADDAGDVNTLVVADLLSFFQGSDAVFC